MARIVELRTFITTALMASCMLFLVAFECSSASAQVSKKDICSGYTQNPTDFNDVELLPQQFDPRAPQNDLNGLMLNPQWGWQIGKAGTSPTDFPDSLDPKRCKNPCFRDCTGGNLQTDFDPILFCPMCNFGKRKENRALGHVNWFPATYTGTICFHNCSFPDMDYTFSFVPDGKAGLTRWNPPNEPECKNKPCETTPKAFHIEFDSRETVNKFQSRTWSEFRKNASPCILGDSGTPFVNSCDETEARNMISKKRAVVIGLVGLDSEHEAYSELHPVYAIAIEMNDDVHNNTWIVFARNFGNEGNCSSEAHPFSKTGDATQRIQELKILLPPPDTISVPEIGDPLVTVKETEFYRYRADFPKILGYHDDNQKPPAERKPNNNRGILVSFKFDASCHRPDDPDCDQWSEGEIRLDWGGKAKSSAIAAADDACIGIVRDGKKEKEEAKRYPKPTALQALKLVHLLDEERGRALALVNGQTQPSRQRLFDYPVVRMQDRAGQQLFLLQERPPFNRIMSGVEGATICKHYTPISTILFPDFTEKCVP